MTSPQDVPSGTLHVVATIPVRPESVAEATPILATLVEASRGDDGCLSYTGFASSSDGVFVTIEEWRSEADLDAHMQTEHVATAIGAVTPLLAGDIEIHRLSAL